MSREKQIWCPVQFVLEIIDGKWTMQVIEELLNGTKRHSELSNQLNGINPKTLTDRLRRLEEFGLIRRKMYEEIPPRVEYSITARGRDLTPVIKTLRTLGISWQKSMRHNVSALEPCGHCFERTSNNHQISNRTKPAKKTPAKKRV